MMYESNGLCNRCGMKGGCKSWGYAKKDTSGAVIECCAFYEEKSPYIVSYKLVTEKGEYIDERIELIKEMTEKYQDMESFKRAFDEMMKGDEK